MSNDLTELTDTELDAVSGGKHHPGLISLGNIVTQVNVSEQSAAIVALANTGSITQTNPQTNTSSVTGGNPMLSFGLL
jgi:bacteriocin-like protein